MEINRIFRDALLQLRHRVVDSFGIFTWLKLSSPKSLSWITWAFASSSAEPSVWFATSGVSDHPQFFKLQPEVVLLNEWGLGYRIIFRSITNFWAERDSNFFHRQEIMKHGWPFWPTTICLFEIKFSRYRYDDWRWTTMTGDKLLPPSCHRIWPNHLYYISEPCEAQIWQNVMQLAFSLSIQ